MQKLETAINLSVCFISDILLFIVTALSAHSIEFFSRKCYSIIITYQISR